MNHATLSHPKRPNLLPPCRGGSVPVLFALVGWLLGGALAGGSNCISWP